MNKVEALIDELCPEGVPNQSLESLTELRSGDRVTKSMMTLEAEFPLFGGGTTPTGRYHLWNAENSVAISRAGSAGFVNFVAGQFWATDVCFVAGQKKGGVNIKYIFYWLKNHQPEFSKQIYGGSMPKLNKKYLWELAIPVPPLEVQQEIVSILDKFTELEAELEAELEVRTLENIFFRNMLLSFGPEIEWSTLGEVADYVNGKAHEKLVDSSGTMPLITARFISRNGEANRYILPKDVQTPAAKGDVALVLSDLPNGRALARSFYIDADESYAINQRVARLRVRDSNCVDSRFMFYYLDRNPSLVKHDNGVDQTHLSKSQVTELEFPIPPIEAQRKIVRVLDLFDSLLDDGSISLTAEITARRQQYEYYRNKLLTFKEL